MFDLKAIQAYTDFVARRAHNAGYKAFQEGYEPAPLSKSVSTQAPGLKAGTKPR